MAGELRNDANKHMCIAHYWLLILYLAIMDLNGFLRPVG